MWLRGSRRVGDPGRIADAVHLALPPACSSLEYLYSRHAPALLCCAFRMKTTRHFLKFALIFALGIPALAGTMVQPTHAPKAIVATVQGDASNAGVEVMKAGGNAVDAAVAVGFALTVTHPQAGNIGGGGFMLFRRPDGEVHFLDYREKAPSKATSDMYLDSQGNVVPDLSLTGYRAIGVPGSVAGLAYAQQHWGKLSLARVMEPAIRLARDGYTISYEEAKSLHDPGLAQFSESRRIFQRDGNYLSLIHI